MKIMLLGWGRSGKGTFCEVAASMGITAMSSSKMASEIGLFDELAEKHGHSSQETFYPNRHIDRDGCYNAICAFVKDDPAKLGRAIFSKYDIYDGCRDGIKELPAIQQEGLFDISIWIDAGDRVPPEPTSSNSVTKAMADIVIENTGSETEYREKVKKVLNLLFA